MTLEVRAGVKSALPLWESRVGACRSPPIADKFVGNLQLVRSDANTAEKLVANQFVDGFDPLLDE